MVKICGYNFEGPWGIDTYFNDVPGIYVIYTSQYWLDVGETDKLGKRLNGNNHDRKPNWVRKSNGYTINLAFLRIPQAWQRLPIEASIRLALNPLCGDR